MIQLKNGSEELARRLMAVVHEHRERTGEESLTLSYEEWAKRMGTDLRGMWLALDGAIPYIQRKRIETKPRVITIAPADHAWAVGRDERLRQEKGESS